MNRLTPREKDVIALLAKGMSPLEVANQWGVSVQTVYNYTNSARRKTSAKSTMILVLDFAKKK